ncbi:MAG: UDPGP type 1 family protein [Planctomycetes bacterium]|nr:UDPGP type 1 family protein [Planctomycetota bacterium]
MTDLRRRLLEAGQAHAWERLERLEPAAHKRLEDQLARLDLALVTRLARHLRADSRAAPRDFEPPELFPLRRGPALEGRARAARELGQELLASGRVGFVLVAGGQASRLGFEAPKGAFPIGPVSARPLFALHAQRLRAATRRHGVRTPWYVMTSPANDAATRAFFAQHAFFGLEPADVFFFAQDMLPALDEQGRMLFAGRDELFLAPNGHGGCLLGLASSGALDDMRRRGLTQLSYFQVDNPLVRPADPLFLGLHAEACAGMSSKVVTKRDAGEKVGVLGRVDGELACIEYSDLPAELREARAPSGELRFRAGNIAVHALTLDFVEQVTRGELELPWHLAKKQMRVVEADGRVLERTGIKFETFVFDALARSPRSVVLEVERAEEFSPVKNKSGEDSPASCRADLCRLYARWVRAAGLPLPPADDEGIHPLEVDPLCAETQDEFLARKGLRPDVRPTGHLYS